MELLADRDPEEARTLLDPVLELMMEAIHRYDGTVNQVMGDGVMGLFGAPIGQEDHAIRACYAALRIQESVRRLTADCDATHPVAGVLVRIGLNSGEVVLRSIGSDVHLDYTAVGASTHLAARMQQMAVPGSILIGAMTYRLAQDHIEVRALGPQRVKGLDEPIDVYELLAAVTPRSRFQAASARGLSPFVGRGRELAQLVHVSETVAAGRGQVVAIVGEPGVGKSRLIWELMHSDRMSGWRVLEGNCYSYAQATTYHLIASVLKDLLGIERTHTLPQIREKVAGALTTVADASPEWARALVWLLDALNDDPEWEQLTALKRRELTMAAVRGLLFGISRTQPILLVLEDLHWIDVGSMAVVDALVSSIPAERVLLLVSYRTEFRHGWGSRTYYQFLRVDPLLVDQAEELLVHLLGSDSDGRDAPLQRQLIEWTEGNPFFLEESVRSLLGTPPPHRGKPPERAGLPSVLQIPATVHALVAARIDRLGTEAKQLLQAAAVIGRVVPVDLLVSATGDNEEAVRSALAELQAAEFLYETRLYPTREYTFHHAVTHEVAYGSLVHDRRREFHARIFAAMEKLAGDRVNEHVEELAHHAYLGEVWAQATGYLRLAADKAFARAAYSTAVDHGERGLLALAHVPRTVGNRELAIDVRFDLRNCLFALGDHARAARHVEEAEAEAANLGDAHRQAWAGCYRMMHSLVTGQPRATLEHGRRALAIGMRLEATALTVVANLGIGQAQHAMGQYAAAISALESALAALDPKDRHERFGMSSPPAIQCHTWLAWCHAERGEFASGLAQGHAGLLLAEKVQDPWGRASAHFGLGLVHLRRGDGPQAIEVLEQGLEICNNYGMRTWYPALGSALGYAHTLLGDLASARPLLQRAVAEAESQKVMFRHSLRVGWLAEAHLLAGERESAEILAGRALALAREHEERGHEAYAVWLLGRTTEDMRSGEALYVQAQVMARELGLRPLEAHCQFSLGELYQRSQQLERARAAFATAAQAFSALEMPHWVARVTEALAAAPSSPAS
jgi:class 3 adenylate cyclase/tetratricopeptide (TPR) repeat protein